MKTSIILRTILGLTLVAAFVAPPVMAGAQDFTLVNKTGVEIHQFFVSSSATDSWEEDILGDDTLPDGESVEIQFSPKEDAELWDLRIADSEGNTITWERLNLLEISTVTLHYKDGKAWADTE